MVDDNPPPRDLASEPESESVGSSATASQPWPSWAHTGSPETPGANGTSDDELAQALADDFERATHTGAFPIVEPANFAPSFTVEEAIPPTASGSVEPDGATGSDGATESTESPTESPADTAGDPPVRRSIPTAELAAALVQQSGDGSEQVDLIAQLEDQLRLREQDVANFLRWQESKVAAGGADAIAQVESARASWGDIIDPPVENSNGGFAPRPDSPQATHTFRTDAVLDSDLLNAPAPMTAPVVDIPPPTDHAPPRKPAVEPLGAADLLMPSPPVSPTPLQSSPVGEKNVTDDSASESFAEAAAAQVPIPEPAPIPELIEPLKPAVVDPFDFDALIGGQTDITSGGISGLPDEVPAELHEQPPAVSAPEPPAEPMDGTSSDSIRDEDVSDTDRAFADLLGPFPVTSEGVAIIPTPSDVPFEPVSSASVSGAALAGVPDLSAADLDAEGPVTAIKLTGPKAFKVEASSAEPTPTQQRIGRASRLFWLWFATNSSVISVAFGGVLLALGMSLRQAIVATLIGVAVSFLPLGLGTLAGKWSGQPTMIVSRATFGHLGNILPAALAIIVRVFWGAVLLWLLAAGTARVLAGAELIGSMPESMVMIIGLAIGYILALVIAFFGYGLIAKAQLVFTVVSALLIAGLIAITWPAVNIQTALTVADGPWILVVTGAVLVFSFVGLVWAVSSADLARYQRSSGSGASSMLWSTFGATIPAFVLIAYGAVLAASNPDVAKGLIETPLDTIALLIPIWYPVPLVAALAFSLLSGVVVSIYSGGFALQAVGLSVRRPIAVLIVGLGVAALAAIITFSVADFSIVLRDIATSLAVPVAAWAGIFGAEMMIRTKQFSAQALLVRGGTYPDFRWTNVAMLTVASAIGFGFTTASVGWLAWQGYLFNALGVAQGSELAASDLGVFVALAIGILTPIVAGIRAIRRQEAQSAPEPVRSPD